MVDRVEERFNLKPDRRVSDTAYGTGPMLGWMVEEKRIAPHVPVWERLNAKTARNRAATLSGMSRLTKTAVLKDMRS